MTESFFCDLIAGIFADVSKTNKRKTNKQKSNECIRPKFASLVAPPSSPRAGLVYVRVMGLFFFFCLLPGVRFRVH